MAGNLSRSLTLRQKGLLDAIRAGDGGGLTTRELTRLRIYVNEASTRGAVRRLEARGLVKRTGASEGIIWAAT